MVSNIEIMSCLASDLFPKEKNEEFWLKARELVDPVAYEAKNDFGNSSIQERIRLIRDYYSELNSRLRELGLARILEYGSQLEMRYQELASLYASIILRERS